jgi:uncharacterized protein YyaL (SSP411 family)
VRVFNIAGVANIPSALRKGPRPATGAVAWVCRGTHCLPPIDIPEELESALASSDAPNPLRVEFRRAT